MGLGRTQIETGDDETEVRTLPGLWYLLRDWLLSTLRAAAMTLAGLASLVLAGLLAAALASWNPADPSFSTATGAQATNWLGYPGAVLADGLLQWVGLAAAALILPPLAWGMRLLLLAGEPRWTLKLVAWPLSALVLAIALAGLPVVPGWSLQVGIGGAVGDLALAAGQALAGPETWVWARLVAGIAALLIGLALLGAACGLRTRHLGEAGALAGSAGASAAGLLSTLWPRRIRSLSDDEDDETDEAGADHRQARPGREPRSPGAFVPEPVMPDARAGRSDRRIERTRHKTRKPADARQKALPLDTDEDPFEIPPLGLLAKPKPGEQPVAESDESLEQNARQLETVLADFGVRGQITSVRPGPVVTLYEFEPAAGIKASRIISLADDIARSMSAVAARVAVVPGRNVIGIELPNRKRAGVLLRELLSTPDYDSGDAQLTLALGKDISGAPVMADLARMPHLLIAGTTGSGKSVAINTMILSLLYRLTPAQCRLILIDPKMLELSVYDGIPHLLAPVVTEPKKAIAALKWTVREMEDRYRKMSKLGVRNIAGYNERVTRARAERETLTRRVQTGFDRETGEPIYEEEVLTLDRLPFIVVVVDEMADLMLVAGKEIEGLVQRLAQMARAAGIHLITATQRPSVDVITGTIKANFPTRISFQVTSKIDSRTILGEQGAEQLLGQGDMLYMAGGGRIRRTHGPFVSDAEVEAVVKHLKKQGRPEYLEEVTAEPEEDAADPLLGGEGGEDGDDLYRQAVEIVARDRKATTSYIQRRLQIGYNRAARIIERMEEEGILSAPGHTGKREILIDER